MPTTSGAPSLTYSLVPSRCTFLPGVSKTSWNHRDSTTPALNHIFPNATSWPNLPDLLFQELTITTFSTTSTNNIDQDSRQVLCTDPISNMSEAMIQRPTVARKEKAAKLSYVTVSNGSATEHDNVDSAVDMTFPATVRDALSDIKDLHNLRHGSRPLNVRQLVIDPTADAYTEPANAAAGNVSAPQSPGVVLVNGMPFAFDRLMEMGEALASARREREFPATTTPLYNPQAIIEDYNDLQRLNALREAVADTRDHALHPDIARLYVNIQRRIQDRDVTHGEVAAEANIRARILGLANGTSAEAALYNLMRHAVNSTLRVNGLDPENQTSIVDAAASRIIDTIRNTVQDQAARGAHGVTEHNMDAVMENIFGIIEHALEDRLVSQTDRLDANATRLDANATRLDANATRVESQINNMGTITNAQNAQVTAIAGHVNAIDNHVHAMGNNVNAMSTLVNSTNSNVASLSTNVITLQTVANMIPQMASNAVREMLREMLPGIIGPAVEQAFAAAITNEFAARLRVVVDAMHAHSGTYEKAGYENSQKQSASGEKKTAKKHCGWFSKFNIFRKRRGGCGC
ncbi:hypothetical protein SAMD00023353_3400080 [Rosellinia necatrix]|uniref:Uncharacterized protein n=1 Tax=Rosellinia necatrix TaxID=77044 RepID=A0A1W2TKX3_ROSNE|nr:hypothetical protein SAMD00023353_3400080 [Rosellinia necatrix]